MAWGDNIGNRRQLFFLNKFVDATVSFTFAIKWVIGMDNVIQSRIS